MTESRRNKLILMWVVLIVGTILLGLGLNHVAFHKDAIPAEPGHYEARVYVTNYGDCYHSGSCGYLHTSKIAIGLQEARNSGYRACSSCGGRSSGTIYIEGRDEIPAEDNYIGAMIAVTLGGTLWVGLFWYNWIDKTETEKEKQQEKTKNNNS